MRTICVPLDGSAYADSAIPLARRLAEVTGAALDLVSVYTPPLPVYGGGGAMAIDRRLDTEVRSALGRHLDTAAKSLAESDGAPRVATNLLTGEVVSSLLHHLRETAPDLVVMTTHGRSGASRFWLGSVADSLLRASPVPVMLVPPSAAPASLPGEGMTPRILVPLDGSPEAERIIETLARVMGRAPADVFLLRVVVPLHQVLLSAGFQEEYDRDVRQESELALEYINEMSAKLGEAGISASGRVRVNESIASAILESASEVGASMIAMSSHGRGPLGRFLLGSVADKVIRGARVPVLLRAPASVEAPESHDAEETVRAMLH